MAGRRAYASPTVTGYATLKRRCRGLFLVLLAIYALTAAGTVGPQQSDGRSIFAVTAALVDRHALDVQPAQLGVPGAGGLAYSKYGVGQSLASIPLYLAGEVVAQRLPLEYRLQAVVLACSLLNTLLLALLGALLPLLAWRLGLAATPALWVGVLAGLTTPLWPYAGTFFSEPLIALCLLLPLLLLWPVDLTSRIMHPLILLGSGAALGLAVLARLDSLVYVPFFLLAAVAWATRGQRLRTLLLVALPVLAALDGIAWYNMTRFGSTLQSGYGRGAMGEAMDLIVQRSLSGPNGIPQGAWNLLASPGKGLIFYAPLVLLAPWGAWRLWRAGYRGPVTLLGGLCLTDWLVHANVLIRWLGGWAWGPRFMVPVVPLLVLLAGGICSGREAGVGVRGVVATLALAGLLVQMPAVVADYHPYLDSLTALYSTRPHDPAAPYRAEEAYVPSFALSPIRGQWRYVLDPATWRIQKDWGQRPPTDVALGRTYGPPVPRMWWATLASEGIPWKVWTPPMALLALLGVGGGLLLLGRRDDAQSAWQPADQAQPTSW